MGIGEIDSGARYICEGCSFAAKPRKALRGSPSLELVLWLALLVPGAIYAWWRYRGARLVRRVCGDGDIVREDEAGGAPAAGRRQGRGETTIASVRGHL